MNSSSTVLWVDEALSLVITCFITLTLQPLLAAIRDTLHGLIHSTVQCVHMLDLCAWRLLQQPPRHWPIEQCQRRCLPWQMCRRLYSTHPILISARLMSLKTHLDFMGTNGLGLQHPHTV